MIAVTSRAGVAACVVLSAAVIALSVTGRPGWALSPWVAVPVWAASALAGAYAVGLLSRHGRHAAPFRAITWDQPEPVQPAIAAPRAADVTLVGAGHYSPDWAPRFEAQRTEVITAAREDGDRFTAVIADEPPGDPRPRAYVTPGRAGASCTACDPPSQSHDSAGHARWQAMVDATPPRATPAQRADTVPGGDRLPSYITGYLEAAGFTPHATRAALDDSIISRAIPLRDARP